MRPFVGHSQRSQRSLRAGGSLPSHWSESNREQKRLFQHSFKTRSICFVNTFVLWSPNIPQRSNLRAEHPSLYGFSVNAHRSFCLSEGIHPPILFPPSTFLVPYRTSSKRSIEVQCTDVSWFMFLCSHSRLSLPMRAAWSWWVTKVYPSRLSEKQSFTRTPFSIKLQYPFDLFFQNVFEGSSKALCKNQTKEVNNEACTLWLTRTSEFLFFGSASSTSAVPPIHLSSTLFNFPEEKLWGTVR